MKDALEKLKGAPWYIWAGLIIAAGTLVYLVWSNNQNNQQATDQSGSTADQSGGNLTPADASGGYYGTPSGTDISGMLMDLQNEISMLMNSAQNANQAPAPTTTPPVTTPPGPPTTGGGTPPPPKKKPPKKKPPTIYPGGPGPGSPVPGVFHPAHAQRHLAAHTGGVA